ncbi:hypothetical protein Nepgr_029040 [Nepenthes gracilis]|uniref:Uncharacterized protein n=1 Tax=Nepenthes gracilis TaxID=150966 RepID=A0AAD3TEP3_NEPGR|nr:hypothetical protein Nepgr_029040 [Nepenthes gracilis]
MYRMISLQADKQIVHQLHTIMAPIKPKGPAYHCRLYNPLDLFHGYVAQPYSLQLGPRSWIMDWNHNPLLAVQLTCGPPAVAHDSDGQTKRQPSVNENENDRSSEEDQGGGVEGNPGKWRSGIRNHRKSVLIEDFGSPV